MRSLKDAGNLDLSPAEPELVAKASLDALTVSASLRGCFANTLANFIQNQRSQQATASHILRGQCRQERAIAGCRMRAVNAVSPRFKARFHHGAMGCTGITCFASIYLPKQAGIGEAQHADMKQQTDRESPRLFEAAFLYANRLSCRLVSCAADVSRRAKFITLPAYAELIEVLLRSFSVMR